MVKVVIIHGGELANDVAQQVAAKKPSTLSAVDVTIRNASERPKTLLEHGSDTIICFIMQTIENASPTEEGGTLVRFFKRKTHPEDLFREKFAFCVLGLGDSNLLLDRQTTSAKDCNQVAQELDSRLEALGGNRAHSLGMADERHGLEEVEPWIDSFWASECFK
mmetsp:Transcript_30321/g.40281  ORF Transcript_30321/g.40281 Transcript_30321/m.40281 type:complete len:164 (+) Transcript_30321:79-570(+)